MAPLALFGIENGGLNLAVNLLVLSLVVVYVALVYWTYSDARRRITDPMLVGCATAASLFPFIGTIVYLIVRPPEFLDDVHERELEIAAAEARLSSVRQHTCPHCDFEIEPSFLRCPSCLRRLKEPCTVCGKPLDPRWKICPYCEAEVGQAPAQPRRRERRVRAPGRGQAPAQGGAQPLSAGASRSASASSASGQPQRQPPAANLSASRRRTAPAPRRQPQRQAPPAGDAPQPQPRPADGPDGGEARRAPGLPPAGER